MRGVFEALMYLAFSAAALPMAWMGVSEVIYFHAHPEQLQTRDSAFMVLSVTWGVQFMLSALIAGALMAVIFLIAGPRAVRLSSGVLASAWLLAFLTAALFKPPTFTSMARIYWDSTPFAVLALLPWICAGVRFARRSAGP